MYKYMIVIKFNDQYFEHGDEVVVTKKDNSVVAGSIIIKDCNNDYCSNDWNLRLDVSEKYHKNMIEINTKNIVNIQKANV